MVFNLFSSTIESIFTCSTMYLLFCFILFCNVTQYNVLWFIKSNKNIRKSSSSIRSFKNHTTTNWNWNHRWITHICSKYFHCSVFPSNSSSTRNFSNRKCVDENKIIFRKSQFDSKKEKNERNLHFHGGVFLLLIRFQ